MSCPQYPFTSTTPDTSGYRYRGRLQGLVVPRSSEEAFGHGARMWSTKRRRSVWRWVVAAVLLVAALLVGVL